MPSHVLEPRLCCVCEVGALGLQTFEGCLRFLFSISTIFKRREREVGHLSIFLTGASGFWFPFYSLQEKICRERDTSACGGHPTCLTAADFLTGASGFCFPFLSSSREYMCGERERTPQRVAAIPPASRLQTFDRCLRFLFSSSVWAERVRERLCPPILRLCTCRGHLSRLQCDKRQGSCRPLRPAAVLSSRRYMDNGEGTAQVMSACQPAQ